MSDRSIFSTETVRSSEFEEEYNSETGETLLNQRYEFTGTTFYSSNKSLHYRNEVGRGVFLCNDRETNTTCVVKRWEKDVLRMLEKKDHPCCKIEAELKINQMVSHENIVKAMEIFCNMDDDNILFVYMVFEYMERGDIITWDSENQVYVTKENQKLSDEFVRDAARAILSALQYLKDNQIAHRDIKPQNILVNHEGKVKLTDFGEAIQLQDESMQDGRGMILPDGRGTDEFRAPETYFFGTKYDAFAADIWSFGISLYCLKYLKLPFVKDKKGRELVDVIMNDILAFPCFKGPLGNDRPLIGTFLRKEKDQTLRKFLNHLLSKNPVDRPSVDDALIHEPYLHEV